MKKNFLLGVGCQKGGTTWLSSYLVTHPQCAMGVAKEYHTFDVLASLQQRQLLKRTMLRLITNLKSAVDVVDSAGPVHIGLHSAFPMPEEARETLLRNLKKTEFCFDLHDYIRYFQSLVQDDRIRLTGDITPEYAVLSEDDFRSIRGIIEGSGSFTCKVVFMMRDPIDRILSSEKMSCRRLGISEDRAIKRAVARYKATANRTKSQYEKTIRSIEAAFDPENIQYIFYEELFRDKDIGATLDFLGLDPVVAPDFGHNPLPSGTLKEDIPPQAAAAMRDYFSSTYDFIADKFGKARVDGIWRYSALERAG